MRWFYVALAAGCAGGTTTDTKPSGSDTDTVDTVDTTDTVDTIDTVDTTDTTDTTDTVPTEPTDSGTPPTDSGTTTTDSGTTTTTSDSPFANCTAVESDSFGTTTDWTYDGGGRPLRWEFDLESDGIVDESADYTYVVAAGIVLEYTMDVASGEWQTVYNDAHGHAEAMDMSFGPTIVQHTLWKNTHDKTGSKLVHSVQTDDLTSAVVDTDYDACEWWVHEEDDANGTGSTVTVSDAVWTDAGGCVPQHVDIYVAGVLNVSADYDAEGRLLGQDGGTWSSTWVWTCP